MYILILNGRISYSAQSQSEIVRLMSRAAEGCDENELQPVSWTNGKGYSIAGDTGHDD